MLSILELFGNQLEKLQLQKLLFILAQSQEKPNYHFVPYKFGCFSFQANADMGTLKKYGMVSEFEKSWVNTSNKSYLSELKNEDYVNVCRLKEEFEGSSSKDLIRYTYLKYPYFAIKSQVATKHLNTSEVATVNSHTPYSDKKGLYTIGYEGISLEEYGTRLFFLNRLKLEVLT